jgi:non-specific serine/threonine protein kinase/protein-serine/threonine kinase
MEGLAQHLLQSVKRIRRIQADARVACVNVIKTARLGVDRTTDDEGVNLHVARLVALRAWAASLELSDEEVTFAILEGPDPAAVIIGYAVNNQVDHILMGARGSSSTRRFLGSVSSQVVAEAPCSVTVVRIPAYEAPATETLPAQDPVDA